MIPLRDFNRVKNKYCIHYCGNCSEYLVQLYLLIPQIEDNYKGIQIFLCCKEEHVDLFGNKDKIIKKEKLVKEKFACVKYLNCDMKSHPVESFLKESNIKIKPITEKIIINNGPIVLSTKTNLPTKKVTKEQIDKVFKLFPNCLVDKNELDASILISPENEFLFKKAADGARTILIPNGFGENLYKSMFKITEILI